MMTSPKDPTTDPAASDVPSLSEAFSNQIEVQQPLAMVQISIDQNAVQITLHKLNGMNYLPSSQLMKLIVQG